MTPSPHIIRCHRLSLLQQWAEAQGLELAAECHLLRLGQAAQLIRADKSTADQVSAVMMMMCPYLVTTGRPSVLCLLQPQLPANIPAAVSLPRLPRGDINT